MLVVDNTEKKPDAFDAFIALDKQDYSPEANAIREQFYRWCKQTVYLNLMRNPDIFAMPEHKLSNSSN